MNLVNLSSLKSWFIKIKESLHYFREVMWFKKQSVFQSCMLGYGVFPSKCRLCPPGCCGTWSPGSGRPGTTSALSDGSHRTQRDGGGTGETLCPQKPTHSWSWRRLCPPTTGLTGTAMTDETFGNFSVFSSSVYIQYISPCGHSGWALRFFTCPEVQRSSAVTAAHGSWRPALSWAVKRCSWLMEQLSITTVWLFYDYREDVSVQRSIRQRKQVRCYGGWAPALSPVQYVFSLFWQPKKGNILCQTFLFSLESRNLNWNLSAKIQNFRVKIIILPMKLKAFVKDFSTDQ